MVGRMMRAVLFLLLHGSEKNAISILCVYSTFGRIDSKADFDFDFDLTLTNEEQRFAN